MRELWPPHTSTHQSGEKKKNSNCGNKHTSAGDKIHHHSNQKRHNNEGGVETGRQADKKKERIVSPFPSTTSPTNDSSKRQAPMHTGQGRDRLCRWGWGKSSRGRIHCKDQCDWRPPPPVLLVGWRRWWSHWRGHAARNTHSTTHPRGWSHCHS